MLLLIYFTYIINFIHNLFNIYYDNDILYKILSMTHLNNTRYYYEIYYGIYKIYNFYYNIYKIYN
jgi:hypothetical protein